MNISITKIFTAHAAHRLPNHDGKCANTHGHTYKIEITVIGPVQLSGPSEGMIIDFDRMKVFWERRIAPLLDHQYLNETIPVIPTAEMLACWLVPQWNDWAQSYAVKLERIRVWETESGYAEVTP